MLVTIHLSYNIHCKICNSLHRQIKKSAYALHPKCACTSSTADVFVENMFGKSSALHKVGPGQHNRDPEVMANLRKHGYEHHSHADPKQFRIWMLHAFIF